MDLGVGLTRRGERPVGRRRAARRVIGRVTRYSPVATQLAATDPSAWDVPETPIRSPALMELQAPSNMVVGLVIAVAGPMPSSSNGQLPLTLWTVPVRNTCAPGCGGAPSGLVWRPPPSEPVLVVGPPSGGSPGGTPFPFPTEIVPPSVLTATPQAAVATSPLPATSAVLRLVDGAVGEKPPAFDALLQAAHITATAIAAVQNTRDIIGITLIEAGVASGCSINNRCRARVMQVFGQRRFISA